MTIEEFIKLISSWMKEIKKSNDEFEHQDCFMGFEIKNDFDPLKYDNIKMTKSYQELRKIYDIFNLTKRMIEENLFNMFFFKYLDYTLNLLKISKEDCLAITLDRINWAINLCTKEELKKWLHEENQAVLQYPDAVKKLKYKHHSEEEIENQVKLQLQDLKKIRKYIDEDGNILPVP